MPEPRDKHTEQISTKGSLDDRLIRLIGIPAFGLIIPNLTGLFGELSPADWAYWIGYLYFIGLSASIWHGNRWLLFQQRKHLNWFSQPWRKLLILLGGVTFYTLPLTVLWIWGWYVMVPEMKTDWEAVRVVALMNVIAVIFVTHAYETVFLIQERESDALQIARTEQARTTAELEALKNQLDPHFMFNSLNTLSALIEEQPEKALNFNERLADVYRYILMSKDRNLVWLNEEMEFLHNYIYLMELRFEEGIQITYTYTEDHDNEWLLPPISLQLLIENAVKHNQFDAKRPLNIVLERTGNSIRCTNSKRQQQSATSSTGKGLQNLGERYRLLSDQEVSIENSSASFSVTLPLIRA